MNKNDNRVMESAN